MARLNVYVPDDLAARAREAGLNVSALTQEALTRALDVQATNAWLAGLPDVATEVSRTAILEAIDGARDELGA